MNSNHSLGSLETASIHSAQYPKRSFFDVLSWFDHLDSESSHLLFQGDSSSDGGRSEQQSTLDIEVDSITLYIVVVVVVVIVLLALFFISIFL